CIHHSPHPSSLPRCLISPAGPTSFRPALFRYNVPPKRLLHSSRSSLSPSVHTPAFAAPERRDRSSMHQTRPLLLSSPTPLPPPPTHPHPFCPHPRVRRPREKRPFTDASTQATAAPPPPPPPPSPSHYKNPLT